MESNIYENTEQRKMSKEKYIGIKYFSEEKNLIKETQYLLNAQGRYHLIVQFNKKGINKTVEGTSTSTNIKKDYYNLKQRAFNNAILKYYDFEASAYDTYINDHVSYKIIKEWFAYNKENQSFKNVKIKGKIYTQIRDKKTGRFIATNKRIKSDFESDL